MRSILQNVLIFWTQLV